MCRAERQKWSTLCSTVKEMGSTVAGLSSSSYCFSSAAVVNLADAAITSVAAAKQLTNT